MRPAPLRLLRLCMAALLSSAACFAAANANWAADVLPGAQKTGQGRLTWFGLKVYDAQLWSNKTFVPAQYAQTPLLLELTYLRALKGADIAKRSHQEIAKLGLGTEAQRAQWLTQMQRIFPDVKAGDALAGLMEPGDGIKFFRNGQLLDEVNDPLFAQAFFAIWLDANTTAPQLRAQLLGLAAGSGR
jgi:hypothetical protein